MKRKKGRPPRTEWPECKVDTCDQTTQKGAKGFCRTHYMAFRRGRLHEDGSEARPVKRVRSYGPGAQCLVPGCTSRPRGKNLCNKHLLQHRKGVDLGVEVPDRGHVREAHSYERAKCVVEGCTARPVNRWMCGKHAQQRAAGIIDEEGRQLRDLKPTGRPRKKDRWVGQDGYVLVKAPVGHPNSRSDGSILEHRLRMEEHIGRYLEHWEIVHHKDGNPSNNDLRNLELMDGRKRSRDRHPPGHEQLDTVEAAIDTLERLVNKGMSNGREYKQRLQRVARRL